MRKRDVSNNLLPVPPYLKLQSALVEVVSWA